MKSITHWGLAALFVAWGATGAAQERSELDYYRQLAEEQLVKNQAPTPSPVAQTIYYECEDDTPANAFVAIPQYFNARNSRTGTRVGGTRLNVDKGRANGFGITAGYSRRVNEWFSFGLMYQYGFLAVRGGGIGVDDPDFRTDERSRWRTHMVGFLPEFNLGEWGRFSPSVIQGFDRARGNATTYLVANPALGDRISLDDEGANTTSLMAWYEKDFDFCNGWSLTPYAGWRSLYTRTKSADPDLDKTHDWSHYVAGGMKVRYQWDRVGFSLRGGVSHRTGGKDTPTFGYRAIAPGVMNFSHRSGLDKTVWGYGAGVSYAFSRNVHVAAGYDGYVGKDTSAHMGSLSFVFPF